MLVPSCLLCSESIYGVDLVNCYANLKVFCVVVRLYKTYSWPSYLYLAIFLAIISVLNEFSEMLCSLKVLCVVMRVF